MVNTNKIKGKMAELGVSVNDLASALGVSRQAASDKLNGRIDISFTNADAIIKLLKLSEKDTIEIFFSDATSVTCQEAL